MRQGIDMMVVASRHAAVVDQRVNNGFFGRLNDRAEERIQSVVQSTDEGIDKLLVDNSALTMGC